ncbi:MAG: family transporter [Frankiales bacterium]|jgi:metabolite-proton symporter|nr:family transporter [Frankiales bacterium]
MTDTSLDRSVGRIRPARRAILASVVGTTIEWYDFFLYGTAAAIVFPHVFFPGISPFAGILASFATQFVGFAARPIGAAIFGHFGDRVGRKATLVSTLLIMGIATVLIGALPGYTSIGVAAPILLVALRTVQGIGVGGEWGGSILLSMEWGSRNRRGLSASWPQLGVPLGLLLATLAVKLVTSLTGSQGFDSWGWRIPFLASFVLIIIGLIVRLKVLESPTFEAVKKTTGPVKLPLVEAFHRYWREILLIAFVRMSEQAPFYLFITFVLTYGTVHLHLPKGDLLNDTLVAAAVSLVTIPVAGMLSDRFGRRTVYTIGAVLTGLFAFPYFALLNTRSTGLVLAAIVVSLIVHDLQYGPQAALIAESFAPEVRYTAAGLGYQLASIVAGGPAPLIATALLQHYGTSDAIAWYIVGCAVVTLVALALLRRPGAAEEADVDPHERLRGDQPVGA